MIGNRGRSWFFVFETGQRLRLPAANSLSSTIADSPIHAEKGQPVISACLPENLVALGQEIGIGLMDDRARHQDLLGLETLEAVDGHRRPNRIVFRLSLINDPILPANLERSCFLRLKAKHATMLLIEPLYVIVMDRLLSQNGGNGRIRDFAVFLSIGQVLVDVVVNVTNKPAWSPEGTASFPGKDETDSSFDEVLVKFRFTRC